jgi:hypothetical protein
VRHARPLVILQPRNCRSDGNVDRDRAGLRNLNRERSDSSLCRNASGRDEARAAVSCSVDRQPLALMQLSGIPSTGSQAVVRGHLPSCVNNDGPVASSTCRKLGLAPAIDLAPRRRSHSSPWDIGAADPFGTRPLVIFRQAPCWHHCGGLGCSAFRDSERHPKPHESGRESSTQPTSLSRAAKGRGCGRRRQRRRRRQKPQTSAP